MPALSDQLVALREWRPDDASALDALDSDPRATITKRRRHRCAGTAVALAITRPGDDVPVGNVEPGCFDDEGLGAALRVSMFPGTYDAALATAAARLDSRWGFEELGLERVELVAEPGNPISERIAARLGVALTPPA